MTIEKERRFSMAMLVLVTVTLAASVFVSPVMSSANQEMPIYTREQIRNHVESLLKNLPITDGEARIRKFDKNKLKIALIAPKAVMEDQELLKAITAAYVLSIESIGVSKIRSGFPIEPETLLVAITDDMNFLAQNPAIRTVFSGPSFKNEKYNEKWKEAKNLIDNGRNVMIRVWRTSTTSPQYLVGGLVASETGLIAGLDSLDEKTSALAATFIMGLVPHANFGEGRFISDSVFASFNRNKLLEPKLPEIDRAFMNAFYSDKIVNGTPRNEAIPLITNMMMKKLSLHQ